MGGKQVTSLRGSRYLADASLTHVLAQLDPAGLSAVARRPATDDTLAVGVGACGIAHVLAETGRRCPAPLLVWIHDRLGDLPRYPPGLMNGLAGIAWTLQELGLTGDAAAAMALAFAHPQLLDDSGLFDGVSGVGLAALYLYGRTANRWYLETAQRLALRLDDTAEQRDGTACWRSSSGGIAIGYGHGASGAAAFLLYLYEASGQWRWLTLGRRALAFDLAAIDGATAADTTLEHGTAGIAAVLVRYYAVLGLEEHGARLRAWADQPVPPATGPGYFDGLAGIGQVCLDCAVLCRDARSESRASMVARAISAVAHGRTGTVTFRSADGDVGCNLASGGAGVALFFHHLASRATSSFMLDDLFDRRRLQPLASARTR